MSLAMPTSTYKESTTPSNSHLICARSRRSSRKMSGSPRQRIRVDYGRTQATARSQSRRHRVRKIRLLASKISMSLQLAHLHMPTPIGASRKLASTQTTWVTTRLAAICLTSPMTSFKVMDNCPSARTSISLRKVH